MSDTNDGEVRGLILAVLYDNRKRHHVVLKPELFTPPISKHEIFCTCIDFRDVGLIKGNPSNNGDGYVVVPTVLVRSVWEGHYEVPLDIDLPPDAISGVNPEA